MLECPHCEYKFYSKLDGKEDETESFYSYNPYDGMTNNTSGEGFRRVFGCPKCNKLFMEKPEDCNV